MSSNFACLSTGSSVGVLIGILRTLRSFNNWQRNGSTARHRAAQGYGGGAKPRQQMELNA
jgi:hypothetical protein